MPHFLSWIVIYGMCFSLLSETNGLVNVLIRKLTGHTVPFFTDAHIFRGVIIWSDVWKSVGWQSIIYMAAIAGVDPNLYDAAHIDGAGRLKSIWYITLPSIMPVVITTLVLKCGNVLDAGFDQIFVMYNTAVRSTVDIIDTWVYRTGLEQWNISLSSAVGLFKSVISMILVILVLPRSGRPPYGETSFRAHIRRAGDSAAGHGRTCLPDSHAACHRRIPYALR
jgi:putative aldouronate transport system permease protein